MSACFPFISSQPGCCNEYFKSVEPVELGGRIVRPLFREKKSGECKQDDWGRLVGLQKSPASGGFDFPPSSGDQTARRRFMPRPNNAVASRNTGAGTGTSSVVCNIVISTSLAAAGPSTTTS